MIRLHRIRGEELYLNADLIESMEVTPDTMLTLIDGRKLVVSDSPEAVIDEVARFRARVLSAADDLRSVPNRSADVVHLVRPEPEPD
jgi:flagellar protein FlbD